ncbi:hypothetical protein ACFE04_007113 [Oxalis oulophora]
MNWRMGTFNNVMPREREWRQCLGRTCSPHKKAQTILRKLVDTRRHKVHSYLIVHLNESTHNIASKITLSKLNQINNIYISTKPDQQHFPSAQTSTSGSR